jgi:Trp operon repressor
VINCTHILYQLSRAGILSQKEVIQEGVFDTLLMLASFSITDQSDEVLDRVQIIQSFAAKAISAISSLISFQASIIELVQGSDRLPTLLRSMNEDVRKYTAKTVAYLSLRNGKYTSVQRL